MLYLFLTKLISRFPFTSGLIILWLVFNISLGIAVLARIINRCSYILLAAIMYFLMYIYYAVWSNFFETKDELIDLFFNYSVSIILDYRHAINSFKKKMLKSVDYLINNTFIILTLILILIYIDAYMYSDNELALILYNQVKGRNNHWWSPDCGYELY